MSSTILELQLGDVIKISNSLNEQLDEQTFIIDYIDKSKTYLINIETLVKNRLSISPDGIIGDGNISKIAILSRSDTPGYAQQHELLSGKWINIHFGGDFPVIITGEITNLENDMIEIKTIDDDVIYINFDYKGIPEDLPIDFIEVREKPVIPNKELIRSIFGTSSEEKVLEEGVEEGEEINKDIDNDSIHLDEYFNEDQYIPKTVPVKDIIREFIIKADQVKFGDEEFGPIIQYVDVSLKSQRYSIEAQITDLQDELLSTIPSIQRTPRVLNNIHIIIERFKQLREKFSYFDKYNNIEGPIVKEATHKPLETYFSNFKTNLYWILPVVKNIKKMYISDQNETSETTEEYTDVININQTIDLESMEALIESYKSNNLPTEQNKYSSLNNELNQYLTPFNLIDDENKSQIITETPVRCDLNTIIDNLEDMYSSICTNNSIKNRRFIIQKYITSLTKTDSRTNDIMSIKSFITLPEPVIRFSRINLPSSSILEKANLNLSFLNYWQLLKQKTNLNTVFVDVLNDNFEFNDQNFANNIKHFVLNTTDESIKLSSADIYKKFINNLIPKTKLLFNLVKKYIIGKLSIVDIVSYLEPFLIYTDDLTFMQYKDIVGFIDEQISSYNKKFVERSRIFRMMFTISKRYKPDNLNAYSIMGLLDKALREEVFEESIENLNTNSELLRKITVGDYAKLFTTAISVQNIPLMYPSEFSGLFEEEKKKLDGKISDTNNVCKPTVVSKYYSSLEELSNDNDKTIYFDKKYDKTRYTILEDSYAKEVLTMSPEELRSHIIKDLIQKKQMTESDADYLANTLVDGYKKVMDGQHAILYKGYKENSADEIDFYIREKNKWVLDNNSNNSLNKINTTDSTILCDIQQKCISTAEDKCESVQANEMGLQSKLLNNVISEFDTKYKLTKSELSDVINNRFKYLTSIVPALSKINTNKMLKYNNQKYKISANLEDMNTKMVSPFQELLNLILKQPDFHRKQLDIIKFTNTYTRKSINELGPLLEYESDAWLYCIKTNVPLLPSFKFTLAEAFIVKGQDEYLLTLQLLQSSIGKLSDDGDYWTDVNSGWPICPVALDAEEGFSDSGFKISSRAVMEDDAGNKILSSLNEKPIIYTTPDTIMINNIANTLSIAMGINISIQQEFIINGVIDLIKNNVESEGDYKQIAREMAEKGKKIASYKDFYNTSLLYYTFGLYLIAVQTSIPSVKTRKTHPGCVRSFTGYPFEGAGDLTSITYLGCVAYDIRESGEPWNVLKGKKREIIITKIKSYLDTSILELPEVKRKFEEKTNYVLTMPANEIPEEHSIEKWAQFLPPLITFKIKHLTNISAEFKRSLMSDLRSGSNTQRNKLLVINSKIILFSLSVVDEIQKIVKKNSLILHTASNEPYLENACCESNEKESTIQYFINQSPSIREYNEIVHQLSTMLEDILSYSNPGMFYSNINTKNKYPSINTSFSEQTIYMAFIHFCKFNSLIPIPVDLLPLCTDKPLINKLDSLERTIQKLKEDGRHYTNEHFIRMLQIMGRHNIINTIVDSPEVSSITKLVKVIEYIDEENDEVVEKSLCNLITHALDSFEIATENYTKEVKDLNNFLSKNIDSMKKEIIDFVKKNTSVTVSNNSIRKMTTTIETLSTWSSTDVYTIVQFYKTFIDNFVNVFPNIILNNVNYDDIYMPKYYGFSSSHENKLKKKISGYYEKFKTFYNISTLTNIITTIQSTSKNLCKLANSTPSFKSIQINKDTTLKPVFDERTSQFLFEYYLLRVLVNYIELSDESSMIVPQHEAKPDLTYTDIFSSEYLEEVNTRVDLTVTSKPNNRMLTGNKKELRQKTTELLIVFIDILHKQKELINISYEEIQDRVFKLREREKDLVTDRLKTMTDEQRDTDTMLKINKLGMYGKGSQKGLTTLDKDFYDEEQQFRDEMLIAERKIRSKNVNANDGNIDMLLDDYMEQQNIDKEIEDEANDMEYMNENYMDGNDNGYEQEYEDYQDDN